MTIMLFIAWALYWMSTGATEGYKWTDTPKIVTAKNYHVFRSVTTASVLALAVLNALLLGECDAWFVVKATVFLNLATWPLYELTLNYVNWGKLFPDKGVFVFGSFSIPHPPAESMPAISGLGMMLSWMLFHIK